MPPLRSAHRERREGVLEHLLETEEFQDRDIHALVEAQSALVGADRIVELDARASVHSHVVLVIGPTDAEDDHAIRLGHPVEDVGVLVGLFVL